MNVIVLKRYSWMEKWITKWVIKNPCCHPWDDNLDEIAGGFEGQLEPGYSEGDFLSYCLLF